MSLLHPAPMPDLAVVSREEMLGHVRPRDAFDVRHVRTEQTPSGAFEEYLVSGQQVGGSEIYVSVRLMIADPADPRVTLSLPGGAGAFPDDALPWLAKTFGGNHAAIDWIGRGRSPSHDSVRCRYDPIWLDGDSYRDAYLFYNIAAIWAGFDWLHGRGFAPEALVGGSWGGVFCFLLAALDPRVARIYPTFGCGGFSIPGVEKRSMWDAAFGEMGDARVREWCRAFDPLLRAADIGACVYFETATNDKFFSLDMAMATWHALQHRNFMALRHNQDHTMNPFGQQPYAVEALDRRGETDALAPARAMNDKQFSFLPERGEQICWPLEGEEFESVALAISEQCSARGGMSREWRLQRPRLRANRIAVFSAGSAGAPGATTLVYLTREFSVGARMFHAATPVHRRDTIGAPQDIATVQDLLPDPASDVWGAPLGDKMNARIDNGAGAYEIVFTGERRQRAVRFGIRPWTLPTDWQAIDVIWTGDSCDVRSLSLFLSCRYHHHDEAAVTHGFAQADSTRSGNDVRGRFARTGFVPRTVIDERFGLLPRAQAGAVLDGFDAIGIIDLDGRCTGMLRLKSIVLV